MDSGKSISNRAVLALAASAVAFSLGYLLARDSSQIGKFRPAPEHLIQSNAPFATRSGTGVWRRSQPSIGASSASAKVHPNLVFPKLNITSGDWEATHALNMRRKQGEYVLKNERPTTRKFLEHDFKEIATRRAAEKAVEYQGLFGELGIPAEVGEQLRSHLAKIHQASLEAEVAIQQVLHARRDYDRRVRSLLRRLCTIT